MPVPPASGLEWRGDAPAYFVAYDSVIGVV
jgi:hypothetical protein